MHKLKHWTERSVADFLYKIATDFVQQIEKHISASGENRKQFADKLGRSPGRVSQVLNSPGNLKKIIEYARAAGKKVAIVAYDDDDPDNTNGLVNSQVFEQCWIRAGRPTDFFALDEQPAMRSYVIRPEEAPTVRFGNRSLADVKGNEATITFSGVTDTATNNPSVVLQSAGGATNNG